MKRNILFGIILSGTSLSVFAQSSDIQKPITITPNVSIQNFDFFGRSTIGKVGVQIQLQPLKKLNLTLSGEVFKSLGNATNLNDNILPSGIADNNEKYGSGYSQTGISSVGSIIPQTTYQGAFVNIDAGIPIKLGDSSRTTIEPFVGIEGKIWNRSADYGTEANPIIVEEKYKFLSPSFGAKINYSTKSKIKLSLRLSASYPVVSKLKTESKSLTNPNTEIDLTKWLSPSIELGLKVKKITLKLRYERINVGTADSTKGCSPNLNVTGLSVGYDF